MKTPRVVDREQWLEARKRLLAKEKELTHYRDALAEQRRELPWTRVKEDYLFEGPSGAERLSNLFGSHSQLVVYHFMLGPGWKEGCPSCSLLADHLDGAAIHLSARNVALVFVSRAPYSEIAAFQRRMGWRFRWVSSYTNTFNRDYDVSFTKEEITSGQVNYNYSDDSGGFPSEEAPGMSAFIKNDRGELFHTYSSYARGLEPLLGVYGILDLVPYGRDEDELPWPMAWVRHHDRYSQVSST